MHRSVHPPTIALVGLLGGCQLLVPAPHTQSPPETQVEPRSAPPEPVRATPAPAEPKKVTARAPETLWVSAKSTRLCPSAAGLADGCKAGVTLEKGTMVHVDGSTDGAYEVTPELTKPELRKRGFVAASDLRVVPDLTDAQAFFDRERESARDARFPRDMLDYASLTANASELSRYTLVTTLDVMALRDIRVERHGVVFVAPIPNGDGGTATALFRFASEAWLDRYRSGLATYSCDQVYCDRVVIVARLVRSPADYTDPNGRVWRVPVFEISRLADRYGVFRSGARS